MPPRIVPDENQPSAAIEIPIAKPLPDYDLEEIEHPTPRAADGILASEGFRDLLDDARGVLMEILAEPAKPVSKQIMDLHIPPAAEHPLEIAQLSGAIVPDDGNVYRPALWIVLRDDRAEAQQALPPTSLEHVKEAAQELVRRLQLE